MQDKILKEICGRKIKKKKNNESMSQHLRLLGVKH